MEKKTNIIRSPLFNETRLESIARLESIGSKFSSISDIISDIMQIKIDKEIFIGNDFEAKKLYNCLFHKLNNNINSNDNKEDLSDQYNGQILQKNSNDNKEDLSDQYNGQILQKNSNDNNEDLFDQYSGQILPKNFLDNYKNLEYSQIKCENLEKKKEKISTLKKKFQEMSEIEGNNKGNKLYSIDYYIIGEKEDETNAIIRINNKVYLSLFMVDI